MSLATDPSSGEEGRDRRSTKLSGEAWPIMKMEMKLIPLSRSQSAWKPFCKVWRLSQLPEPAASVTAGAESWDRKQPKSKVGREVTVSKWCRNTTTLFIFYPDFPFLRKQAFPPCYVLPKFSDQTGLGTKKQRRVSLGYKVCRNCRRNVPRLR